MTRLALVIALALVGCNKPSSENCRKALANMQRLLGTDNLHDDAAMEGEVRRCKGGSTKKAVECAIKAMTPDELHHCGFYKGHAPSGSAGSAPAGSAAGSGAAAGSAATPAGSGSGSETGSGSAK